MKNSKVLVTVSIGPEYAKISQLTHPTLEEYAYRCGADFEVIDQRVLDPTMQIFYEKLRMRDFLEFYDRVLFMDSDIIIHPKAPSIFELVPLDRLGMTNEGCLQSISDKEHELKDFCKQAGIKMPLDWDGRYFNIGLVCFGQEHKPIFDDPPVFVTASYPEQALVNIRIAQFKPKMFCLPRSLHDWSWLVKENESLNQLAGFERYVIHWAGVSKAPDKVHILISDIKGWLTKWGL
jgi:hypothetical protein